MPQTDKMKVEITIDGFKSTFIMPRKIANTWRAGKDSTGFSDKWLFTMMVAHLNTRLTVETLGYKVIIETPEGIRKPWELRGELYAPYKPSP